MAAITKKEKTNPPIVPVAKAFHNISVPPIKKGMNPKTVEIMVMNIGTTILFHDLRYLS